MSGSHYKITTKITQSRHWIEKSFQPGRTVKNIQSVLRSTGLEACLPATGLPLEPDLSGFHFLGLVWTI